VAEADSAEVTETEENVVREENAETGENVVETAVALARCSQG
jgi:hypothetical protein